MGGSVVLGLFEGSVDLVLPKTNFSFGETVEGTLKLKIGKEKKARQLRVRVSCLRITKSSRQRNSHVQTDILYSSDAVLDGEKTYMPPGGEYPFKIQLPQSNVLPQQPQLEGGLGTAMKAFQMLSGGSSRIEWYIEGTLDIPNAIDTGKKVRITVV